MRIDDKLNFGINHTNNNSTFPAKCLHIDNKIKSLLNDLNIGLSSSSSSFFIARFSVRVAGAVAQD